jgi:hypothetical protein
MWRYARAPQLWSSLGALVVGGCNFVILYNFYTVKKEDPVEVL